ncbi:Two-component response regulator YvcP [Streptococcus sp. DD12]|nr:Two-component response regulator YvcP [Streptococcus sp. DD12]
MSQPSLFIIEDDATIVSLLKKALSERYTVTTVKNYRDILREVVEAQPDLILMDITLPYFNGFYWTTEIRQQMTTPIIFISSSDDEMNMVMALDMGADDYIAKPFNLAVLEAKISAFLRRSQQFNQAKRFLYQDYELTRDGLVRKADGQEVALSPTESKIFQLLIENQGQVVTKEDLLNRLWESENFIDHNTLSVNMTRLRKKLSSIGCVAIHTIRGVGYSLI